MNLKYMKVSLFEIIYKKKLNFFTTFFTTFISHEILFQTFFLSFIVMTVRGASKDQIIYGRFNEYLTGGGWGETPPPPPHDCKALWVYSNTQ